MLNDREEKKYSGLIKKGFAYYIFSRTILISIAALIINFFMLKGLTLPTIIASIVLGLLISLLNWIEISYYFNRHKKSRG